MTTSERDRRHFRSVFANFPTGVAVITAGGADGPVGMSANAVCSLSLEPLLVLVCFDVTARTLPVVRDAGSFAINMLRADQGELSRTFASKLPDAEKFAEVPPRDEDGVPVLAESLAWIVCDVQELLPVADHEIAIGAVRAMSEVSGDPLVWYRGDYRVLA
jgi:3-hydroxy-9,10-secoandrosta-1,3,5(10)-triene-9,17-dione monooxygenase reductase component